MFNFATNCLFLLLFVLKPTMIFEPTGDLSKDYCAFCEIDQLNERDDVLDSIRVAERNTSVCMRNIEYCLNKRDIAPLCSAIPHCSTLISIELTGCGLTEHSQKLVAEAVYKSPSVHTLVADFNPQGLFKDPTAQKKDKNEVVVYTSQFRGAHLKPAEAELAKDDGKKKADAKKPIAVKAAEDTSEKIAVVVPTGWQSFLLSGLQVLSLRGNGINDVQAESIAALLETNHDLLSLNLWGNEITSVGAAAFGRALQRNRRLTALDLGHNRIDDGGVTSVMQCLLTMDVSNDEALRLRQKVLGWTAELPVYPTYADLVAPLMQPTDDKKDPKKKEPPKKKGAEGPVERHKGDFDKDCVRLDDQRVRVPGNGVLWCVSFAQNNLISAQSAANVQSILRRREPTLEEIYNEGNIKEPAPHLCGLQLRHVIVENTFLDKKIQDQVNAALQKATTA